MLHCTFVVIVDRRDWSQGERKERFFFVFTSPLRIRKVIGKKDACWGAWMTSPGCIVLQTEAIGTMSSVSLLNCAWCLTFSVATVLSQWAQHPGFLYELCETPLKAFSDDAVSSGKDIWALIKSCLSGKISGISFNRPG